LDVEGNVVWSVNYKAWGEVEEVKVGEVDCPIRFQGQWADEESGLYYNRFRYYEAQSGRFVSEDPIRLIGGLNNYLYGSSSINWLDPFGLSSDKGGEGEIVRRFDSKANIKTAKKNGIAYDPSKGSGIPTATTNIDPVNPDKIKTSLGARSADAYIDIDITGKQVLRRTTKQGNHEIVIQENIKPEDIVGSGKVKKSKESKTSCDR
jgi:RHS repeat-associated protein